MAKGDKRRPRKAEEQEADFELPGWFVPVFLAALVFACMAVLWVATNTQLWPSKTRKAPEMGGPGTEDL